MAVVQPGSVGTTLHNVKVEVQKQLIQTLGKATVDNFIVGYEVNCDCGWASWYRTLGEANEACGLHSAGLDPTPTPPEEIDRQAEERRRAAADEFERVRERMLETGDPFCE